MKRVLERPRAIGINLNAEKCVISTTKVSYFGHVPSDKGVQPNPKITAAIQDIEPPKSKSELETLLSMVNYLAKLTSCVGLCKGLCF